MQKQVIQSIYLLICLYAFEYNLTHILPIYWIFSILSGITHVALRLQSFNIEYISNIYLIQSLTNIKS